jgi:archaellum component FlaC
MSSTRKSSDVSTQIEKINNRLNNIEKFLGDLKIKFDNDKKDNLDDIIGVLQSSFTDIKDECKSIKYDCESIKDECRDYQTRGNIY